MRHASHDAGLVDADDGRLPGLEDGSWHEIHNTPVGDKVLVYFARNGAPLGASEGMIAPVSIGDQHSGPRHVKRLTSIELRQLAGQ